MGDTSPQTFDQRLGVTNFSIRNQARPDRRRGGFAAGEDGAADTGFHDPGRSVVAIVRVPQFGTSWTGSAALALADRGHGEPLSQLKARLVTVIGKTRTRQG